MELAAAIAPALARHAGACAGSTWLWRRWSRLVARRFGPACRMTAVLQPGEASCIALDGFDWEAFHDASGQFAAS